MIYHNVVIIGVGSLGGYLAENISRMNGLHTLTLIDDDFVERKNVSKSIYKLKDVGKLKVNVLKSYLDDISSLQINEISSKYIEGISYLPKNDLVIDCRDVTCKRFGEIDVRLYISYGSLIIDCKKIRQVSKEKHGRYIKQPEVSELTAAASIAFTLISSGKINEMINNQMHHIQNLNQIQKYASRSIQKFNNLPDIVLDDHKGFDKIRNMFEMLPDIIKESKTKELTVFVGPSSDNIAIRHFNKAELTVENNVSRELSELVQSLTLDYPSYTIVLNKLKNKSYIELLPETGGA